MRSFKYGLVILTIAALSLAAPLHGQSSDGPIVRRGCDGSIKDEGVSNDWSISGDWGVSNDWSVGNDICGDDGYGFRK